MKKRVFKYFTIVDYEEEQDYLREQHNKGWKLNHVTFPGIYTFSQCEPEDVVYQLDYNPDRHRNMAQYIQMFKDCGWSYICDFVGYSYFRKPFNEMSGEEEIFNDDESKKDMLLKVFNGRMIPLFIIFALILFPGFIYCLVSTISAVPTMSFQSVVDNGYIMAILFIYSCLIILYISIFIKWILKRKKLQRR